MSWLKKGAVAMVCGLLACHHDSPRPPPTPEEMKEIATLAHVTFPASTKVLMWQVDHGMDSALDIVFEMAASDWPAFLASSPFRDAPPVISKHGGASFGPALETWAGGKDAMARLPSAALLSPEHVGLNLGIDTSHPEIVTVYLSCFET
jgi:hypothetical protein